MARHTGTTRSATILCLGLIFGIVDIYYGSTTAIDRSGRLKYIPTTGMPDHDPLTVVIKQLGHVLSDAVTKMGISAPE